MPGSYGGALCIPVDHARECTCNRACRHLAKEEREAKKKADQQARDHAKTVVRQKRGQHGAAGGSSMCHLLVAVRQPVLCTVNDVTQGLVNCLKQLSNLVRLQWVVLRVHRQAGRPGDPGAPQHRDGDAAGGPPDHGQAAGMSNASFLGRKLANFNSWLSRLCLAVMQ